MSSFYTTHTHTSVNLYQRKHITGLGMQDSIRVGVLAELHCACFANRAGCIVGEVVDLVQATQKHRMAINHDLIDIGVI